jgi:GNAT superfamily N-acetyltransferase
MDVPGSQRVTALGPIRTTAPAPTARLAEINDVIARSKAYWPRPEPYLSAALPLLEISAEYLDENPCVVAMDPDGAILAFGSLASVGERTYVDYLWVRPDRISRGIGRCLCDWLLRCARERDLEALWVLPNPPPDGFYRKRGFVDTGERVPSRIPGGPVFSLLRIQL